MDNKMDITFDYVSDFKLGIVIYHNVLPKSLRLIERLEETIGESTTPTYMWKEALVGDYQSMPEYRNCFDCKIDEIRAKSAPPQYSEIYNIWKDTTDPLVACLRHYESLVNVKTEYMEAINYVKYGVGQHFAVHADHGFSYTCTVSSVMYLNNDYEGGELWFPRFDLKIKPDAGDIIFFPSAYLFQHASLPVTSGTKYSAVTMFDYNDRHHICTGISQGNYSDKH
jgi:hypothetical protein